MRDRQRRRQVRHAGHHVREALRAHARAAPPRGRAHRTRFLFGRRLRGPRPHRRFAAEVGRAVEERRVAGGRVLAPDRFDRAPAGAGLPVHQRQPVPVPQVLRHLGPRQPRGAPRAAQPHLRLARRHECVERRPVGEVLEVAEAAERAGRGQPRGDRPDDRADRARRVGQRVDGAGRGGEPHGQRDVHVGQEGQHQADDGGAVGVRGGAEADHEAGDRGAGVVGWGHSHPTKSG